MAHTLIDELLARSFDSGGQLLVSEAELGTEFFAGFLLIFLPFL